jgi:hypothetical protein
LIKVARLNLADHHRDVEAQRTKAIAGRKAITHMIAEEQLQGGPASFVNFIGFTLNDHACLCFGAARGHELAVDLDQAYLTGIEWTAFL